MSKKHTIKAHNIQSEVMASDIIKLATEHSCTTKNEKFGTRIVITGSPEDIKKLSIAFVAM